MFLWGVATSAHQIEGHNVASDWWAWEENGNVEGGVKSGVCTDHWKHFKQDLERAKSLGLNSYRFSIEWAKIEPVEGKWDESAIDWYRNLLTECERLELKPMATLHHFTLPKWFADRGGFSSDEAADLFMRFVSKVSETIGSRIPLWCTINEPVVYVTGAYLAKFMPPARYAPKEASKACANLLRCHVFAYDHLKAHSKKREGPWKHDIVQVGFAHNVIHFRAERRFHPVERLLTSTARRFYNQAWLDAVTGRKQNFGIRFLLPKPPQVTEALGRVSADFIGLNYYTKAYFQWRPRAKDENQIERVPIGISFARRKDRASDLDWAVYPKGLAKILKKVAAYGLPIIITENGIADRDDSRRPQYLVEHLRVVANAIAAGVDIRGYFHWSLIDNFEWIKGFWPRFGLFSVDYKTLERHETKSARLYRELVQAHGSSTPPQSDVISHVAKSSHVGMN